MVLILITTQEPTHKKYTMKRYGGVETIRNININAGPLRAPYYKTVLYPEVPDNPQDVWVITDFGDRLDLLANQFYGDITLYWIIAIGNPNLVSFGSLFIDEGTQMRIPVDINGIIRSYNNLNGI
jgi:hypothetical protein